MQTKLIIGLIVLVLLAVVMIQNAGPVVFISSSGRSSSPGSSSCPWLFFWGSLSATSSPRLAGRGAPEPLKGNERNEESF